MENPGSVYPNSKAEKLMTTCRIGLQLFVRSAGGGDGQPGTEVEGFAGINRSKSVGCNS
ncbi:MAG: hypothetical protein MUF20_11990 [Methylotetracoccus sp.]|nr:hypothetical protein [Methylotetracoccus sp.]